MVDVCSTYFEVLNMIKHKKQELVELGSIYQLTHKKVLECSQELDVLINLIQFQKVNVSADRGGKR